MCDKYSTVKRLRHCLGGEREGDLSKVISVGVIAGFWHLPRKKARSKASIPNSFDQDCSTSLAMPALFKPSARISCL